MAFYAIDPARLRELQHPDMGKKLRRDGSNAAAVLREILQRPNGEAVKQRIFSLLESITPGLSSVEYKSLGPRETVVFRQDVGLAQPWRFQALNMSDGTRRALGILLALYQPTVCGLVAIEEPEATIHPAAAEVLLQALRDASQDRQILITTHSPDLLDSKDVFDRMIRAVVMESGQTRLAPVSAADRHVIQQRLYTAGDLMRIGELRPETGDAGQADSLGSVPQSADPQI